MQNAVAFANNDVTTVAWSYGQKLERCMGFAVYRIDSKGKETPLPAVAVFPGMRRMANDSCEDPKDALRASLSGDMVEALTDFVARVKSGGKLYAALYELHDEELVGLLEKAGKRLAIVLSTAMQQEVRPQGEPKTEIDGNQDARDRLTKTASVVHSRRLRNNQSGHNKFVVSVDKSGHPRGVLFGSTNWTPTGLCAQTNNTIALDNHFAWRVAQKDPRQKGDGFLKAKPDDWQAKYFNADGSIRVAQLRFWLRAIS